MKVKILKCIDCRNLRHYRGHYCNAYQYTVRVYDGVAQGTYVFEISKEQVLAGNAEKLIHEELDKLYWSKIKEDVENDKAQSIVGKIFHW